jgi:hypothetical protein
MWRVIRMGIDRVREVPLPAERRWFGPDRDETPLRRKEQ